MAWFSVARTHLMAGLVVVSDWASGISDVKVVGSGDSGRGGIVVVSGEISVLAGSEDVVAMSQVDFVSQNLRMIMEDKFVDSKLNILMCAAFVGSQKAAGAHNLLE